MQTGLRRCSALSSLHAALLLQVILLAASCSPMKPKADWDSLLQSLPKKIEISSLPYYAQEENQCGPAALAMVLAYKRGKSVSPSQLKGLVYSPSRKGSLQLDLIGASRRMGYLAYKLDNTLQSIIREAAGDNPVIVLLNKGLSWFPIWHYAVVIGYDGFEKELILRSGLDEREVIPESVFANIWNRAGSWAIVVLDSGRTS